MTENLKMLIRAICYEKNDQMKYYAETLIKADKSAKDQKFRENMLELLTKEKEKLVVPPNCAALVTVEDEPKINIDRYYLTVREKYIAENIENMYQIAKVLENKKIRYVNSALFYGESGTGKTTLARYIAASLHLPFIYLNLSYVLDSYLGKTQQNIANVFRFANENKCVLMLDEIDAIGSRRGSAHDVAEMNRVVISLMQNIDDLKNNVILLSATNRFDIIDEALARRFSVKHKVEKMTEEEKKKMIVKYLESINLTISDEDIKKMTMEDLPQGLMENKIIQYIVSEYKNNPKLYEEIKNEQ